MTRPLTVLVAETSPDIRDLICMLIDRDNGWQVIATAADGAQALDLVGSSQPDVVLLDTVMLVRDGTEALPLIRKAAPHAKIIILSNSPFEMAGKRAREAGAHGYLEKNKLVKGLIPHLELVLTGHPL